MTHKHFNFNVDRNALLDLYYQVKPSLRPLDLSRSFLRKGYHYDETTNPNWLDLTKDMSQCLSMLVSMLALEKIDYKMSISELPAGYAIGPHKDVGRSSVMIIPIIGYDTPIFFDQDIVYYNDQCLLIDSTANHWVIAQSTARVGLQISFKKNFQFMKKHFEKILDNVVS